jgi:hypothetical protein
MRSAALVVVIAGALAFGAAAGAAIFGTHKLTARMTPGQVVTPSGKPWKVPSRLAHATGSFTGTLSSDGRRLSWRIAFSRLGSPRLVIADVHAGGKGQFGPVVVRLCAPCRGGQRGVTRLKAGVAQQLVRGRHFITLITDRYPNGVVRGQLLAR